jgi:hypothetical protein
LAEAVVKAGRRGKHLLETDHVVEAIYRALDNQPAEIPFTEACSDLLDAVYTSTFESVGKAHYKAELESGGKSLPREAFRTAAELVARNVGKVLFEAENRHLERSLRENKKSYVC